jgi:4-diphosphocytidyl-2-C-methyl-D-erythritol kinase
LSAKNRPAPAKINLFLAVTGLRQDGFHDLLSVAAPLTWGDSVAAAPAQGGFSVHCESPGVPADRSNLVIKAAEAFAKATGWTGGATFTLEKRIPPGSGLGGASSDAVAALEVLNDMSGGLLDGPGLARVAATVGSDCTLFLSKGPVVMRGRGERVEALPKEAYSRIRGMRVALFKPAFSVSTPWAYARLAADGPHSYTASSEAEPALAAWIAKAGAPVAELFFNSFERPVFAKFAALPVLLERLRGEFGIEACMSGSGSACFALLAEDEDLGPVAAAVREAWGPSAFVVESRIA